MTTPRAPRTADIVGHACGATLDRRAFLQRAAVAGTAVVAADVGTRLRADADASAWTRAEVVVGG